MQRCTRCKKLKPINNFNFKYKKRNVRQVQCRECTKKYLRAHYVAHRNYYLKKAHIRNYKVRGEIRKYVWDYLQTHACVDCGETNPIVLEFDHTTEKKDAVSNMIKYSCLNHVMQEIEHCQVRCANCHRKATAKRQGWSKGTKALVA
jgi:hypothetical protein